MRLHQRVGRLNRYGQTQQVEVYTLRNPSTVESRIWDKLNTKLDSIMRSLGRAMDEPEDLLQLVLGMATPSMFRDLFAEAPGVPPESLSKWFDEKTVQFGGRDALDTVRSLVGSFASFDFQDVSARIPRIDLPDMRPFFVTMLELNRRRAQDEGGGLSFNTPEAWCEHGGIKSKYSGLIFDRNCRDRDAAQKVLGVGHKLVDLAIEQARNSAASVTLVSKKALKSPLVVYRIRDRVTSSDGVVRGVVVGCLLNDDSSHEVLRDWELLQLLNRILSDRNFRRSIGNAAEADRGKVQEMLDRATKVIEGRMGSFDLPFKVPEASLLALLWPGEFAKSDPTIAETDEGTNVANL